MAEYSACYAGFVATLKRLPPEPLTASIESEAHVMSLAFSAKLKGFLLRWSEIQYFQIERLRAAHSEAHAMSRCAALSRPLYITSSMSAGKNQNHRLPL